MMEDINILTESIVKIEDVKEEPIDGSDDVCWNAFEELEPPIAVLVGPSEKQETACGDEHKGQSTAGGGKTTHQPAPTTTTPTAERKTTITPTAKRKKWPSKELLEKARDILSAENDECQIFADFIAMELRKLEERYRVELKRRFRQVTSKDESLVSIDPLAFVCDASVATIKQEITSCFPDGGSFVPGKPGTIQTQQSKSTDFDCNREGDYDPTTYYKQTDPNSRICSGGKRFHCITCQKAFTRKRSFQDHVRIHTGEKPFHCTTCKKTFTRNWSLQEHMRIHTGEKPFQCSICERAFGDKGRYNYHMLSHTGEKPFPCSICEKAFTQKGSLDNHVRTHTGEKPFQCSICEKTFTQKGTLDSHVRTHTGEKPFKCFICEKTFTQKQALSGHVRTHTGEKPFQCSICEKTFTQKGHLQKHMRTHSEEKRFVLHL
ncbi:Zinc finger protein squeeze [Gryllus bimaculatus]|nr:Zinc finger protein squeeze [Gryllus bimaculatus]